MIRNERFAQFGCRWVALCLAVLLCGRVGFAVAASERDSVPSVSDAKLAWWSDARFGMFIHWGLYAEDGCFWKGQDGRSEHMMRHLKIPVAEYEKLAADFNPVKFNADEWVRVA